MYGSGFAFAQLICGHFDGVQFSGCRFAGEPGFKLIDQPGQRPNRRAGVFSGNRTFSLVERPFRRGFSVVECGWDQNIKAGLQADQLKAEFFDQNHDAPIPHMP